jgi:hypothetical protein
MQFIELKQQMLVKLNWTWRKVSELMLELRILVGLHMVSLLRVIVILKLQVLLMNSWLFTMVLSLIMRYTNNNTLTLALRYVNVYIWFCSEKNCISGNWFSEIDWFSPKLSWTLSDLCLNTFV